MKGFAASVSSLLLLLSMTAGSATAVDPWPQEVELDEVLVLGKQAQVDQMRKELVRLEDLFHTRYNELNTNDDFDIHCMIEARTGTRIEKRSCRAIYMERALQEEGKDAFVIRQDIQDQFTRGVMQPKVFASPPVPAAVAVSARLEAFRKNVRDVAGQDPELIELLRRRAELAERFLAARRAVFRSKPPPAPPDGATPGSGNEAGNPAPR
jgi:hypothetical protein